MLNWINIITSYLPVEMAVMITAAMPVVEVKVAIPMGIGMGLTPWNSTFFSFLGSIVPVPFILLGIRPLFNFLKHTKLFKTMIQKITTKTIHKTSHLVHKYGPWALLLFVAIPLPGTGVWTGSLAAALLDIRFKLAFPAIVVGNAIATVLIATLTLGVFKLFS